MDYLNSLKVITDDIASLEAIIDDFGNIDGVPALQVNIAKLKCRNAVEILTLIAESIEELVESNKTEHIECEEELVKQTISEDKSDAIEEVENKAIESKEDENKDFEEFVSQSDVEKEWENNQLKDVIETELDSKEPLISNVETDSSITDNDSQLIETVDTEKTDNQILHKTIIAETFSANPNTLIGKMGESASTSVIAKNSSNLFQLIGLNDKFLFVRELFNGKIEKYQVAIDAINRADSYDKAMQCAEKMVLTKERGETFVLLSDFIKRKFSVNG